MKYKIFVDGQEGTTGLIIHERLASRNDLEILEINHEERKNPERRKLLLNQADIAVLCLPDSGSREAVSLIDNEKTKIIDASTAFRTHPDWTYGLPEMKKKQRDLIKNSSRVSVPGCHATGFILSLFPLVEEGIVQKDYPVVFQSVTGYSGAGRKLIGQYEVSEINNEKFKAPRFYSLNLMHKHLPEMQEHSGLNNPPLFIPVVSNYYKGMITAIPLFTRLLNKKVKSAEIKNILASYYSKEYYVLVKPYNNEANLDNGYLNAIECNGTNRIEIFVFGNEEHILIVSRLDNLGKGSSGAALQCMNIMLGLDEKTGLEN